MVLLLAICLMPFTLDAQDRDQQKQSPTKVEITGVIKDGVLAIGGETTGTTIKSGPFLWELDLSDVVKGKTFAKEQHGQSVIVRGRLEHKKGVEIPDRMIVHVDSLQLPRRENSPDKIEMQVQGLLEHGVQAIGGETAGTVIRDSNATWELDFQGNKALIEKAARLDEQRTSVKGVLTQKKGVEVPDRKILLVTEMEMTPKQE